MLEKLSDAASVENVTARKLGARLSAEFTSVADATKLVSVNTALVELGSAIGIKARRAVLLILNSEALVTAQLALFAERKSWLVNVIDDIVSVDQNWLGSLLELKVELRNLDLDT